MRNITITAIATATALAIGTAHASWFSSSSSKPDLSSQMGKVSYSIGYDLGKNFHAQSIDVNTATLEAGLNDGIKGAKPQLSETDMQSTRQALQKEMIQKAMTKEKQMAQDNMKASDAYLAKVAKEPGVKMLEKGLYYKVVKQGTGPVPKATDTVTVNYKGMLPDGKGFDSSYKRGKPATFKLDQVIPGWTKALEHMPQGSTWEIYIAPDLGYCKFAPPVIGPNQALTFQVDLMDVKAAASAPATHAMPAHTTAPAKAS
jgi:FKBP-type peptidyl-prolyl cis-trans isomerase FklB